ncbi:MAG TPA: deoxyribonuclease IV [Candidatus Acidoferrum sp.]|jgi:deoxyribonuclease-4
MPEPKTIPNRTAVDVEELRLDPLDFQNDKFDPEDEYRPEPPAEPLPPAWVDGSLRIGIHASIGGGYVNALESARKLGCNALQIFSASPRMWAGGPSRIPDADAAAFRARREELALGPLVIHANYLINLAAQQPMLRTRSIQAFHDELVRAVGLGADFLVVHPGTRGEAKIESAIATIANSVKEAVRRVQLGKLRILIENTAGMGTAVGANLEELAAIVRALSSLGVGACLDTAHLFAAGYDISTPSGLESTILQIEQTIGLDNVYIWHVNDSKTALGGRVDRHENIGHGKIKSSAFARILQHAKLSADLTTGMPGRAFVLETPIEEPGDDRRNVAKLWELSGQDGPPAEKGFSMLTAALKKKRAARRKEAAKVAKNIARKNLLKKKKG